MLVDVAIGIWVRDERVLLSKRPLNVLQANLWEFPGGKRESNETFYQTLCREFNEELGVTVTAAKEHLCVCHQYPAYSVLLKSYFIQQCVGEPTSREGQPLEWVAIKNLQSIDFPAANDAFLAALQLSLS